MLVKAVKATAVELPFRFSFGHALASRDRSANVLVKSEILVGDRIFVGWGESVPRSYVTAETVETALGTINYRLAPLFQGSFFKDHSKLLAQLSRVFAEHAGRNPFEGAAFCALELSLMDALGKIVNLPLSCLPQLISDSVAGDRVSGEQIKLLRNSSEIRKGHSQIWQLQDSAVYGGVVPFGRKRVLALLLDFYKKYGFKTVKLKVGGSLNDDLAKVKLARQVMGEDCIIRVDANCAWNYDQARYSLAAFRPFAVASCEQPLPAADLEGFSKLVREVPETIIADESLTSPSSARALIDAGCRAFNVRLSKVGGLGPAVAMIELAQQNNVECHLGAQVGESGILAAAQRHLALAFPYFANVEGAMNLFLLKGDLVRESMTVPPGGRCSLITRAGNGVTVKDEAVRKFSVEGRC